MAQEAGRTTDGHALIKDPWGLEGLPTSAYVIAAVQLTGSDEELPECRSKVVATLEPYGGRN
ncbi:hypothetical protein [Streptomyces sp. NPDC001507]|uniref:hypothetical protein n=1 Tax=Streptomyces sp. NPDC001507 TaxID=3364579 RepID=UPI003679F606